MPGSASDSYDPEWGTSDNAHKIWSSMQEVHELLSGVLRSDPVYILDLVEMKEGPKNISINLTERQCRLLRFAAERARDTI